MNTSNTWSPPTFPIGDPIPTYPTYPSYPVQVTPPTYTYIGTCGCSTLLYELLLKRIEELEAKLLELEGKN